MAQLREAVITTDTKDSLPHSEHEASHPEKKNQWFDCRRESNYAGTQAAAITGAVAVGAHFLLQKKSPTYNKIDITGKLIGGALLAYAAFYNTNYYVHKRCMAAHGHPTGRPSGAFAQSREQLGLKMGASPLTTSTTGTASAPAQKM